MGPPPGHGRIMDPGARMSRPAGKRKFGTRENNFADLSRSHALRKRAVLSSNRKTWATPSSKPAPRAASTIWRHSAACMPMGFSHSTGLPQRSASSTSARWQAFGVVTKTASTSGDRHMLLGRIEGQRNVVLPGRLSRLLHAASRQRGDPAVLRQRESRHQPLYGVQSEAENSEAYQKRTMWRGRLARGL